MPGTPSPNSVSTKQQRIAELAKQAPDMAFTSLSQHMDTEWMREAFTRTRKNGAVGVDGQSAGEFASKLEENLQWLIDQAKSGNYRAPPVRRVHIPKGDGKETRPIGIPTFADKVLQRSIVMLLEPVYEQDFYGCSYGFRPGKSAHQALDALWKAAMSMGGGWVLEVDIRKFFDMLDHQHIQTLLSQRVRDGVVKRLIGKWLNAGVMKDGSIERSKSGSPQGGVVSPLLANIYLHEVLDKWVETEVKPRLKGRVHLIRYADDAILLFSQEADARRVLEVLPQRFGKYGLVLHPEKTRLIPFQMPRESGQSGQNGPGSFDFLGFTHHWAKSQKGQWVVRRTTAKGRFTRGLKRIAEWCRRSRHRPVAEQAMELNQKLRGHYGYYGITGNWRALVRFRFEAIKCWYKWLARRSQRGLTWENFNHLLRNNPIAPARAVHSKLRLAANP